MTKLVKEYGNHSISALKGADRVRLRPGVVFGSDGIEGSQHSFFEILSNSIDEAREGYGTVIEVTRYEDFSLEVKDFGRGIPLEYNEREQRWNWELIFCELYAGGKYDNLSGDSYEYSLGLNGMGACSTQYSSEYMVVEVIREGHIYNLHFEKGYNVGGLKKEPTQISKTGTRIKWKPDRDVFNDVDISLEYLQKILKKQAVVNSGIKFLLFDKITNEKFEYFFKNGIIDYVNELSQEKNFSDIIFFQSETKGRDREDKPEYKLKIQICLAFNNDINVMEYYHNSSFLEYGGSPEKGVKIALMAEVDKYIKQSSMYTKDEKRINFTDIQDSLILITNSFSTYTSYENQTKKAINNKFIQDAITDMFRHNLEVWFIENKVQAERFAKQVLVNKRSRENAEKARINLKKKLGSGIDNISNRVKKFVDCRSRDISKRELYIVEGDSALGSCKMGRDADFQAVIPVRGKILNCLKADLDKIFNNEIIMDIIKVLGCGMELSYKHSKEMHTFELANLKWSKIIICTDADVDGYQIRTLILTMLYKLVPTLIQESKVYIAETPLFEITASKNIYFAYNEKEKKDIIAKIRGSYTIQRSKGLGENEPEMMWKTTMNPETRRLILVEPDEVEQTATMFETLLGDNIEDRKSFIAQKGSKYIETVDIS